MSEHKVLTLASGIRFERWDIVAEFMNANSPVFVSDIDQAKKLQDELTGIGKKSTRVQEGCQWKVIVMEKAERFQWML